MEISLLGYLLVLLASLIFLPLVQSSPPVVAVGAATSPNIINKTCEELAGFDVYINVSYTFCVETLRSVPQSAHADLRRLTLISLWLSRKKAKHAKSQAKALLKVAMTNNGSYKICLVTCCQIYDFAMDYLKEADNRIKAEDQLMAHQQFNGFFYMYKKCEDGFEKLGFTFPLAEVGDNLLKVTTIAFHIFNRLKFKE